MSLVSVKTIKMIRSLLEEMHLPRVQLALDMVAEIAENPRQVYLLLGILPVHSLEDVWKLTWAGIVNGSTRYIQLWLVGHLAKMNVDWAKEIYFLSLEGMGFFAVPPNIACLENLVEIDFSRNNLVELPASMAMLKKLKVLYLDYNEFPVVPEVLEEMHLTQLSIEFNPLLQLSKRLRALSVEEALWIRFVDDFPKMTRLQTLQLSYFSYAPDLRFISRLKHLRHLSFHAMEGMDVPQFVWSLSKLESLSVELMDFPRLDPKIGQLQGLKHLFLRQNCLKDLPKELVSCQKLKNLSLEDNVIKRLPPVIQHLTSLEVLNLSWNEVRVLPRWIGALTNLKRLSLDGNKLNSLPNELTSLKNLAVLDLAKNNLTSVPPILFQMKNLCFLDLQSNPLPMQEILALQLALPQCVIRFGIPLYLQE